MGSNDREGVGKARVNVSSVRGPALTDRRSWGKSKKQGCHPGGREVGYEKRPKIREVGLSVVAQHLPGTLTPCWK